MRQGLALIAAAWLFGVAGAAAQTPLPLITTDAEARSLVQAARSWQVERARAAGVEPMVATARIDLNSDGQAEIVAVLQTPVKCQAMGLRDCPLIILRPDGSGRYTEVGTFFGDAVQLLDSRTLDWRDLESRFTKGPWRRTLWNGTMYRLTR